jgi:hypothetical protein
LETVGRQAEASGGYFEGSEAIPALDLPDPDDTVVGSGKDALTVGAECDRSCGLSLTEGEDPSRNPTEGDRRHRRRRHGGAAGLPKLQILLGAPLDVLELRERFLDRCVIEPQRNETALLVERVAEAKGVALETSPLGLECVPRDAEHEYPRPL